MLCGKLDEKGVGGRMDTCIYVAEYICCPPETITKLLINYTPIQKTKLQVSDAVVNCSQKILKTVPHTKL